MRVQHRSAVLQAGHLILVVLLTLPLGALTVFFTTPSNMWKLRLLGGILSCCVLGVFFGLRCSKCLPIGGWNYFIFWLVYLSLCKTMWLSYINIMIPLSLYLNTWENNLFFFFFYEVNNEHSSLSTSNKFSPSLSNSYSIGDP